MTIEITSTLAGAIKVLRTHFNTVAAENSGLNVGVYVGLPVGPGQSANNYLMIGELQTGRMVRGYKQEFRGLPAVAAHKSEDYSIPCTLQVWDGTGPVETPTAPLARLNDAMSLLNGVLTQLQADPQGSTQLTSGTWQVNQIDMPQTGPFSNGGWGVLMTFSVHVFNVTIPN
jgi:hypothetical protein